MTTSEAVIARRIAHAVELAIDLLDLLEGDPDFEVDADSEEEPLELDPAIETDRVKPRHLRQ